MVPWIYDLKEIFGGCNNKASSNMWDLSILRVFLIDHDASTFMRKCSSTLHSAKAAPSMAGADAT